MRNPQLLLLIPILVFVVYFLYDTKSNEPPTEAASTFLQTLRRGDVEAALREFGDNTCHCAPEGGYVSYLQYEGGYDPNLSFLLGNHFYVGKMNTEKLPFNGEKYVLPWDKPEDVLVYAPLEFGENERPYFLPIDMAYGYEMTAEQVKAFEKDPTAQWKRAFTLRLRNSLEPGTIKERDPKAKKTEMERAAADGLLPKEYVKYVHPKDAAGVKDGAKVEPASAFAAGLPRLKSVMIGMKVVRRGILSRWAVKKAGFNKPVIVVDGKDIVLEDPVGAR
jgi:hypothetical protein